MGREIVMKKSIAVACALLLTSCGGMRTLYTADTPRLTGYSLAAVSPPNPTAPTSSSSMIGGSSSTGTGSPPGIGRAIRSDLLPSGRETTSFSSGISGPAALARLQVRYSANAGHDQVRDPCEERRHAYHA
jgi:hypothetical protein